MSRPAAFCLGCRALLDAGQGCECGAKGRPVALGADATSQIEEALLVVPHVDRADLTTRAVIGGVIVLGPLGLAFFAGYAALLGIAPAAADQWPWVLGLPYAGLALAWVGFLAWSAIEERKPYCGATSHQRPKPETYEEARVDAGSLVASEIHQRLSTTAVVVRDARIEEPLVLRRAGEQILVSPGRVDVLVPTERWRAGRTPLVGEWGELPEVVFGAGVLREATLRRGDRVRLFDGRLEPLEPEEATFREASEQRWRWVPTAGRTRLAIGNAG